MVSLFLAPFFIIFYWLVGWEWTLLGNPLYFSHSRYSAHAIDVIGAGKTFAVHDWHESIRQYILAVRLNFLSVIIVAALAGLATYIIRSALTHNRPYLSLTYLLGPMIFFPISLFLGQNAIDIRPGVSGSFNIRYGTTIAPLMAVGCGLLITGLVGCIPLGRFKASTIAAIMMVVVLLTVQVEQWQQPDQTAVLQDVAARPSALLEEYSDWLKDNYDYGRIMAESFGVLNGVQIRAGIDLAQYITESNGEMWDQALNNPTTIVEWVIIRKGDLLDSTLDSRPEFLANFELVFSNDFGQIWRTIDHETNSQR
jgi:hypothetical protein